MEVTHLVNVLLGYVAEVECDLPFCLSQSLLKLLDLAILAKSHECSLEALDSPAR